MFGRKTTSSSDPSCEAQDAAHLKSSSVSSEVNSLNISWLSAWKILRSLFKILIAPI